MDLLAPHERARRKEGKYSFFRRKHEELTKPKIVKDEKKHESSCDDGQPSEEKEKQTITPQSSSTESAACSGPESTPEKKKRKDDNSSKISDFDDKSGAAAVNGSKLSSVESPPSNVPDLDGGDGGAEKDESKQNNKNRNTTPPTNQAPRVMNSLITPPFASPAETKTKSKSKKKSKSKSKHTSKHKSKFKSKYYESQCYASSDTDDVPIVIRIRNNVILSCSILPPPEVGENDGKDEFEDVTKRKLTLDLDEQKQDSNKIRNTISREEEEEDDENNNQIRKQVRFKNVENEKTSAPEETVPEPSQPVIELDADSYFSDLISGQEPRDDTTGELMVNKHESNKELCTARDCNHNWDPISKCKITITFPITDDSDDEEEADDKTKDSVDNSSSEDESDVHNADGDSQGGGDVTGGEDSQEEKDEESGVKIRRSTRSGDGANANSTTTPRSRRGRPRRSASRLNDEGSTNAETTTTTTTCRRFTRRSTSNISDDAHSKATSVTMKLLPPSKPDTKEYFSQTIDWDLGSPSTPTPIAFATQTATEYGLSLAQTLDLMESIQSQIDVYINYTLRYTPPITLREPFGKPREQPLVSATSLSTTAANSQHLPPGSKQTPTANANNTPKSASGRPIITTKVAFHHPPEYQEEALRRLRMECVTDLLTNTKSPPPTVSKRKGYAPMVNSIRGKIQHATDHVCHICHARKKSVIVFKCGINSHAYCNFHCETRLGYNAMQIMEGDKDIVCPICSLSCVCPKCARRLDAICGEMDRECKKQDKDVYGVEIDCLPLSVGRRPLKGANYGDKISGPAVYEAVNTLNVGKVRVDKCSTAYHHQQQQNAEEATKKKKKEKENAAEDVKEKLISPTREGRTRGGKRADGKLSSSPKRAKPSTTKKREKPNPDIFPVEMYKGKPVNTDVADVETSSEVEEEDGNVDHCILCSRGGDLLCCDTCPRAFHRTCLHDAHQDDEIPHEEEDGEKQVWTCKQCVKDITSQKEDYLDINASIPIPDNDSGADDGATTARSSLDVITVAFIQFPPSTNTKYIGTLAKLHQTLLKLMDYDFGHAFREPVNTEELHDYLDVIDRPMDLGTIANKLVTGGYAAEDSTSEDSTRKSKKRKRSAKKPDSKEFSEDSHVIQDCAPFNTVIFNILSDIETVYHNCFVYNAQGSSIYRMAQVQRRKFHTILASSIEPDFDPSLKTDFKNFMIQQENERLKMDTKIHKMRELNAHLNSVAKGAILPENFIEVASGSTSGTNRKVVIYDPTSRTVTKTYNTLKAACAAALFIQHILNHVSEFPLTEYAVKNMVKKAAQDPKLLLFGYRWFYESDYLANNVIFEEQTSKNSVEINIPRGSLYFVQRISQDLESTTTFHSLEAAFTETILDHPLKEKDGVTSLEKFGMELYSSAGDELIEMLGFYWRLVPVSSNETINYNLTTAQNADCITNSDPSTNTPIIPFGMLENEDFFYGGWCWDLSTQCSYCEGGFDIHAYTIGV